MDVSNNYTIPIIPYIKTLDHYYMGSVPLDKTLQKSATAEETIAALRKCNKLMAYTATMDLKKYGFLTLRQKFDILESVLNKYIQNETSKGNTVYATIELTSSYTPHAHIMSNGYIYNYISYFAPLGANNRKKGSIQKVKNFDNWLKYITKEDCKFEKLGISKPHYFATP